MSWRETVAKSLYGVIHYLHDENRSWFTNSKHFSKKMNGHFGLCSQWKSRCLETLMQLDIYLLGSRSEVIDCGVASFAYESESCFCRAVRSTLPSPSLFRAAKAFRVVWSNTAAKRLRMPGWAFPVTFSITLSCQIKVSRARSASFCVQLVVHTHYTLFHAHRFAISTLK